jgi:hypothetical protein
MSSKSFFQKIVVAAASMIIKLFVYNSEHVLPFYLDCNNKYAIGKRCLDGDIDSVFFT